MIDTELKNLTTTASELGDSITQQIVELEETLAASGADFDFFHDCLVYHDGRIKRLTGQAIDSSPLASAPLLVRLQLQKQLNAFMPAVKKALFDLIREGD